MTPQTAIKALVSMGCVAHATTDGRILGGRSKTIVDGIAVYRSPFTLEQASLGWTCRFAGGLQDEERSASNLASAIQGVADYFDLPEETEFVVPGVSDDLSARVLGLLVRSLMSHWSTAVLRSASTGNVFRSYREVPFDNVDELLVEEAPAGQRTGTIRLIRDRQRLLVRSPRREMPTVAEATSEAEQIVQWGLPVAVVQ